ncbi:MAG: hypothetical protein K8T20_17305 [Planctomycetes bacterium]|nr:hypothetical protein [Planctomycetota bacterium]
MKRAFAAAVIAALAGCASGPAPSKPAPERYRDSWIGFDTEAEAMLRAAGRNRLKVEACAGRARSSLDSMRALLGEAPAARLAAISEHFAALARTIATDNAVSSGQERAVSAVRDEIARDFAPEKVAIVSREPEPPQPAPPGALALWEDAHRRFETHARGGETAHLVQDYSELRAAMEGFAKSEEDRFRIERFLRDYERIADLAQAGKIPEQDLKGLPVLAADIRAAFGEKK